MMGIYRVETFEIFWFLSLLNIIMYNINIYITFGRPDGTKTINTLCYVYLYNNYNKLLRSSKE
jgi:hypothetical protein